MATRLRRIAHNANGVFDRAYALCCEPALAPVAAIDTAPLPARGGAPAKGLRLFHFNDLHNHLSVYDADGTVLPRFSVMSQIVRRAREAAVPSVFVSVGDDHTGGILDEIASDRTGRFRLDPSYRVFSAAGVDVAAIGNHEFDRGSAHLAQAIRQDAAFPILSANIHSSEHLEPGRDFHPAIIALIGGLRVGFVGLTSRIETRAPQNGDPTIRVSNPVTALERVLPPLSEVCDTVVILSHCGYGDSGSATGKAAVARDLGEADFAVAACADAHSAAPVALLGAHTHTRLNEHGFEPANRIGAVPIMQAEANGRFLGEVTLDGTPPAFAEARLHPIAPTDDHDTALFDDHIRPLFDEVDAALSETIVENHIAGLDWDVTQRTRYGGECGVANLFTDAVVARVAALTGRAPDLAMLTGGSLLSGLPRGPVSYRRFFEVMPYPDEVYIVDVAAEELAEILCSNARRVLRAGEDLATDRFIGRGFVHFSAALRYRIDPGADAASARPRDVELCGEPLCARREPIRIATVSYLAMGGFGERWAGQEIGGGVAPGLTGFDLRGLPQSPTGLFFRKEVEAHLRGLGRIGTDPHDGRLVLSDQPAKRSSSSE